MTSFSKIDYCDYARNSLFISNFAKRVSINQYYLKDKIDSILIESNDNSVTDHLEI